MDPTPRIFEIPAGRVDALAERIEKIARRAGRLAQRGALADPEPIALMRGETKILPPLCLSCGQLATMHPTARGCELCRPGLERVLVLCTVTGAAPKLAGWEFLATLQHEDAGTILRVVPSSSTAPGELDGYRQVPPQCDHCGLNRRRNDTFVLRADGSGSAAAGELRQVGRNCLADFLGGLSPEHAAALVEILAACGEACEAEEGFGSGGHVESVVSLPDFLSTVATQIRLGGWLSRTAARERDRACATADSAWSILFPVSPRDREDVQKFDAQRLPADTETARAALAYADEHLTPTAPGLCDYEHNLRVVLLGGYVTWRLAGIAASLLGWYQRRIDAEHEAQRRAEHPSQHIGTIGRREVFTLTLRRVHHYETNYGTTHLHRFEDTLGNVVVWKATAESLDEGVTYRVKGTVKAHDAYRGENQTCLTRCKCEITGGR